MAMGGLNGLLPYLTSSSVLREGVVIVPHSIHNFTVEGVNELRIITSGIRTERLYSQAPQTESGLQSSYRKDYLLGEIAMQVNLIVEPT
jgi:hypothetical protein